ncbi:MAG TPA: UPF0182 family protein [Mycobacteriales bacterium]
MRPPLPVPTISRRARVVILIAVALVLFLSLLGSFVSLYVNWLWFGETGYRMVFDTILRTRVLLFVVFGVLMALAVGGNLVLAYRVRPPFRPMSLEQQNLERYRSVIEPRRRTWLLVVTALVGLFAGLSAQGRWQVWQLWRHGQQFGITDPQFHRDIAYFAFSYPFQRFILGMLFAAVLLGLLGAVVVHYLFGGLRLQTPGERVTPAARAHLSVLLGLFVLLKAAAYYLDRYGLAFSERSAAKVTGASYTDVNAVLPAKTILMIIAVLCAIAFLANVWFRNFQLPTIALVLLVLSSVLIGGAYPALIQQFQVKPNADQKEQAFIVRNIAATRAAYGIDKVKYIPYDAKTKPSADALASIRDDTTTIPNARLLDPNVLSPTYDQLQRILNFYGFADKLDIDRYTVDGKTQDYIVGARELDQSGLTANQTNWINSHLVYTHGNGFVAAPANTVTTDGQPDFTTKDLPTTGDIKVDQPRIYYGELFDDVYSIVGKSADEQDREFDLPGAGGQDIKSTYDGKGGVDIGGVVNRLAFAWHYKERNILFSSAIGEESKILYVRDPRDRVEKAAPFLKADGDPYPVVVDGKVLWVVDAYTTLNGYPYSEHTQLGEATQDSLTGRGTAGQPQQQIDYIRNSVKATVDAYDGTVTLYQFGPRDPVLETWKGVFPGIVQPENAMPKDLREHLRYPEDLFKVQRTLLTKYHVDDPVQFYNNQNFWEVPEDPNPATNSDEPQPPYYLLAQTPEQERPTFQLTSALNALKRPNLAAYVTASSDPEDYGTIRVLELPSSTTVPGPKQAQAQFNSDINIAQSIALLDQRGSNVLYGNLLTLPVGGGLLYVEPLYVQGQGNAYPLMRKVLAAFGDKVAYEDTLAQALDKIFGEGAGQQAPDTGNAPSTPSTPTPSPSPGSTATPPGPGDTEALPVELDKAVGDIQNALEALRTATKDGDFAKIGQAQSDLSKAIDEFNRAKSNGGSDGGQASATPTPTPTPTG